MSDQSAGEATPRPWTMSISDLQRAYRLSYAQAGDLHHDLAHNDERDALIAALNAVIGLTQLVCSRDDCPPDIRKALLTSHRMDEAYTALSLSAGAGKDRS